MDRRPVAVGIILAHLGRDRRNHARIIGTARFNLLDPGHTKKGFEIKGHAGNIENGNV